MSSSSSSSITSTTVNGRNVISGLSSGVDVDSIVNSLITADSTKINKLKQQKQLAEWKQDAYRDITSDIQTFAAKYFDTTSSSSLLSQKTFQQFSSTSSNSAVSVTTTTNATTGSHTVSVSQLATAATLKTSGRLSKDIAGTTAANYNSLSGSSFVISLDGTKTTVTLDSSVTDVDSLQTAIDDAVGDGKVAVSADSSGILTIAAADDSGVQAVTLSSPTSGTSALSSLGFDTSGSLSNRISTSSTLETLSESMANSFSFNSDGQVELSINGVSFNFDKDTKLSEMISEINSSDAGVTMKYDELNDELVMTAATTGAQKTLTVSETGSTFLTAALSVATAGTDAKATIDNQSVTRSSNTITLDGITYTLNDTTTTDADATDDQDATITVTQDTDAIYDSIKSFVDDYNSLISTINGKLSEEYDSDYPPLTSAQEEEMTDTEISNWNTKAKTGLLQNDATLENLLNNLRTALSDKVSGQSITLASIGITTESYDEKGKLYIDEDTLKSAIQSNSTGVKELFTQSSTSYSGTSSVRTLNSKERQTRTKEEGIAYKLYDIIQDNISTLRDSAGNKGSLLELAGVADDTSDTDNTLTDKISDYEKRITKEQDRLDDEKDRLYTKYSAMETYISEMNTQLTSLESILGSSSS